MIGRSRVRVPTGVEGRMFFCRVNFRCWLLFRYPFHPRVTAVARKTSRKRSQSFCQKCRWKVTAKHACALRMWLCMKWHSAWLYGVHRTHRDGSSLTWLQPCQRCKYTTRVDIHKSAIKSYKKLVIRVELHSRAVSPLKSRKKRYITAVKKHNSVASWKGEATSLTNRPTRPRGSRLGKSRKRTGLYWFKRNKMTQTEIRISSLNVWKLWD